ncbi:hypothetical protein AYI70_g5149 [Smittium culicis]|uniref:Uncharacterized protein n=1 Tax=Smittium culicis TaxID=133412 RepID=A0A1R1XW63_9FUNG|nr:hypothetical protein AYI70_g5149 [Smittium culicis]
MYRDGHDFTNLSETSSKCLKIPTNCSNDIESNTKRGNFLSPSENDYSDTNYRIATTTATTTKNNKTDFKDIELIIKETNMWIEFFKSLKNVDEDLLKAIFKDMVELPSKKSKRDKEKKIQL